MASICFVLLLLVVSVSPVVIADEVVSVSPVVIADEVVSLSPVAVSDERTTGSLFAKNPANWTYCVAKDGADQKLLQAAIDWVCGEQKYDCSAMLEGHLCYEPNTLEAHASIAFNMYYYKNLGRTESCVFNGAAWITTNNPSHGLCIFAGSSRIGASDGSQLKPPPGSSMASKISTDCSLLPLVLLVVVSLVSYQLLASLIRPLMYWVFYLSVK
ncbi:glucan endo-1,3-beta-glucosidase 2-like [Papaver somniferum]|uniref:glucan endo-1,3-beta-glucosidase 2-like n=1 Tax=Papaver somniferum TaxID=3469 RepID=UPI000E70254C|nr:glucan endo-1,3-beta-glucosidase 2-like [Papaver somniferum]